MVIVWLGDKFGKGLRRLAHVRRRERNVLARPLNAWIVENLYAGLDPVHSGIGLVAAFGVEGHCAACEVVNALQTQSQRCEH